MILVDATPLQSEHRLRGVGIYLRHLLRAAQASRPDDLAYLVSRTGEERVRELIPADRRVRVTRPHRPAYGYWLYNELALRSALHRTRPAVLFAPDFNGLVGNPYGITVAVLHDLTSLKLQRAPRGLADHLDDLRWRVYARKLRRADSIVAISDSARRDATDLLGIPGARIRVVHHGVDHDRFGPSVGRGRFAGRRPYLLHVGGYNANKNQDRIVAAFCGLADRFDAVELLFAGPWSEAERARLAQRAAAAGLGDRIRHLGYVADEDLPSLYGNARAFVFPSLEEGFGMPLLEAMASGAPTIASNRSSLPEVTGGAALLVDPLSVAELRDAMARLVGDGAERARLRALGFARAAGFTWEATARATFDPLRGGA